MYVAITIAAAIAIIWFFALRRRELNKAPEQHQLASMMIASLTSGSGVQPSDVHRWVSAQQWSASRRSVRVSHALGLARTNVPEEQQTTLLELARGLIAAP
jgi:uncharacterized protein YjcR